jgi:LuxR family maltose regulon positive regulatory protein
MSDITTIRDRARFVAPRPADHVVSRVRLDERYQAATGRILRVLAPPGYGKSTLVGRWVEQDERIVRWLDLERVDNDPVVLMAAFARGLSDLVDEPASLVPEFSAHDRRFADVAVPSFGAAIGRITEPFVIVIDDTHRVTEPAAWLLLDTLARNVPPESTVVFVGRGADHGSSLPSMRLDPGVVDVTMDDLALDVVETEHLLMAGGVHLDLDAVADLTAQFEGWPAGLRLASLVLASPDGRRQLESASAGEFAYVTDYLRSEWLLTLSDGDRRFLMEAALLRRFSAEMCDQVLDRAASAEVIRRMEHRQLVVLPLDRRGEWYRMHGLLRDWLETELRHTDRVRWQEVHTAAAQWWERAGDVDLAVQHLEWVADSGRRHDLVVAHAGSYVMRGMASTVRRWLAGFSDEAVRTSPGLCLVSAGVELAAGDGSSGLRWVRLLASAPPSAAASLGDDSSLTHWGEIVCASAEAGPAAPLLERAEVARSSIGIGAWHVYGSFTVGGLRAMTGAAEAVDVLLDGAHEAEVVGAHVHQANCLSLAAILLELDGDRDAASQRGAQAHRIVRDLGIDHVPTVAISTAAVHSLHCARAGRRSEALACLDVSRVRLPGYAEIAPWYNVLTRTAMVKAALLLDDPEQASTLLGEIDHHLRFEPDDAVLRGHVAALREQVAAALGISAARTWSLTAAELRVLQYLPTNLSLADIAIRLFISRNTVKSHTASIYRKLGTTSRNSAVELARDAGLLADSPTNRHTVPGQT